jgi:VWFA-related protein
MNPRRLPIFSLLAFLAMCWVGLRPAQAPAIPAEAPQASDQTSTAPGVIQAETNLVLVDVIVTDKKGNYIRDLEAKDFHVFEDDQEQTISSFSRITDSGVPGSPAQPRYLILFFDNSTMRLEEQTRARQAAAQFVAQSASKDHMMAVVDFGGTLRVAQNFTADGEALKRAAGGIKFSAVQPNEPGQNTQIASMGPPSLVQVRSDMAARSVLLAIRNLAKTLRAVPGRKTLILFSAGFALNPERESELNATIDAANKANVAIYPVDVRGLQGLSPILTPDISNPSQPPSFPGTPPGAELGESPFAHWSTLLAVRLDVLGLPKPLAQRPQPSGGGGPAGGTGSGGGSRGGASGGTSPSPGASSGGTGGGTPFTGTGATTGTRGGSTAGGSSRGGYNPGNTRTGGSNSFLRQNYDYRTQPQRSIIPPLVDNVTTNQQVLQALATGTGGFTIFNTNDFAKGLENIGKEVDEYYILGYAPPNPAHDGSYHKIHVKLDEKGFKIRSRNGYYDLKSPDFLAGKPEGKVLEERAASPQPGDIPVSLNAPYFYTAENVARVNVALAIPAPALEFEKHKGEFHSEVNVLGIAYTENGSVAARFSDTVKLDLQKKELKQFSKGTFDYQNNFNIAPGKYTLKVVLGAGGQKFGKYEMPLVIAPYNAQKFQLSGVALSDQIQPVSTLTASLDTALLEERTPLVVKGMELTPSADNRFQHDEKVGFYVEVYEPLMLEPNPPRVGVIYDVIDQKTQQQVFTSNTVLVNQFAQQGNPVIPVGLFVPVDRIPSGEYRLQVRARDEVGNVSSFQNVKFAVE